MLWTWRTDDGRYGQASSRRSAVWQLIRSIEKDPDGVLYALVTDVDDEEVPSANEQIYTVTIHCGSVILHKVGRNKT